MTAVSAFRPGAVNRTVFGNRSTPSENMIVSGSLRSPISSRSRKLWSLAASTSLAASAALVAAPNPAMAATFSVPARRPCSCPPPRSKGSKPERPSASTSAPAPLGPRACGPTASACRLRSKPDRTGSCQRPGSHRCATNRRPRAPYRPPRPPAGSRRFRCWPASPTPVQAARRSALRANGRDRRCRNASRRWCGSPRRQTARPREPRRARSRRPAAAAPAFRRRAEARGQRQRIRFRAARRKHDILRQAANCAGHDSAGILDQPPRFTALGVHRGWIARDVPRMRHRRPRLGAERRGRIPVEIDARGHGAHIACFRAPPISPWAGGWSASACPVLTPPSSIRTAAAITRRAARSRR